MINEQLNEYTVADDIMQLSNYFSIVESSVAVGDTNRKYVPSKNPGSPAGAQADGKSFVTFNISPVGENICDLYNSQIYATLSGTLVQKTAIPAFPNAALPDCNPPSIGICYPDSFEAVSSYHLVANGKAIYMQDNAINEAFVTACASPEAVNKVDIFSKAIHEDIFKKADKTKSACILNLSNTAAGSQIQFELKLKIDLRRFLILNSVRYLPAFAGNIQLRVKFSTDALQITPLSVEDCLQHAVNIKKLVTYPMLTNKFVPSEVEFTMLGTVTAKDSAGTVTTTPASVASIEVTTVKQQYAKKLCTFSETYTYLHSVSIDENVYTRLVDHFKQKALTFPIKRMDWQIMDGMLNVTGKSIFSATNTPLFVNTIFILFKKDYRYFANHDSPLFKSAILNMGAYGNVPAEPEPVNGPLFYEQCSNAMNVNNDLAGFNADVMRSLTTTTLMDTGFTSYDTTHAFMGFPTEVDYTFQQGQTSNSPITFKLTVEAGDPNYNSQFNEKPEIGFLRHCCLSIQVKDNGPPEVVVDDYDLTAA